MAGPAPFPGNEGPALKELRHYFLTGIATLLPLSVTVFLFWFIIVRLGNLFHPLFQVHPWLERLPGWVATLAGFVLFLILVLITGWIATGLIGRLTLGWLDKILQRVPIVKSIYSSVKQVSDTLFSSSGQAFRQAVMVQYPRAGSWTIAFVTGTPAGEVAEHLPGNHISVYVPTTPNPTSGFFLMVPRADVVELNMSVDEALKYVISMGVVAPHSLAHPHQHPPAVH